MREERSAQSTTALDAAVIRSAAADHRATSAAARELVTLDSNGVDCDSHSIMSWLMPADPLPRGPATSHARRMISIQCGVRARCVRAALLAAPPTNSSTVPAAPQVQPTAADLDAQLTAAMVEDLAVLPGSAAPDERPPDTGDPGGVAYICRNGARILPSRRAGPLFTEVSNLSSRTGPLFPEASTHTEASTLASSPSSTVHPMSLVDSARASASTTATTATTAPNASFPSPAVSFMSLTGSPRVPVATAAATAVQTQVARTLERASEVGDMLVTLMGGALPTAWPSPRRRAH